jgi:hypothetical protein
MVQFVRDGGIFDMPTLVGRDPSHTDLIKLVRFEDGCVFVHDGHHRATAIWLGGRHVLDPCEFAIRDRKYIDYLEPNFLKPDESWLGWVTPFDPRTEVRCADFGRFKEKVRVLFYEKGEDVARHYISLHTGYKATKKFDTVPQLADYVDGELGIALLGGLYATIPENVETDDVGFTLSKSQL